MIQTAKTNARAILSIVGASDREGRLYKKGVKESLDLDVKWKE